MAIEIVDGRKVGVRRAGNGQPALLMHCSLAHSGAWAGVMSALSHRLTMTAVDLPGHGETEFVRDLDFQDQAQSTAIMLLEQTDEPAHLIGHSFGATVALRIAEQRPDLVASLSLYEPVYFSLLAEGNPVEYAAEINESADFGRYLEAQDWLKAAKWFLQRWGVGGGFDDMPATQQAYTLKTMPLIVANNHSVIDVRGGGLTLDAVREIATPVLLMEGAKSPRVIHQLNDLLCATLPNVDRRVFETVGHMGPITHAKAIACAIEGFLFGDDA